MLVLGKITMAYPTISDRNQKRHQKHMQKQCFIPWVTGYPLPLATSIWSQQPDSFNNFFLSVNKNLLFLWIGPLVDEVGDSEKHNVSPRRLDPNLFDNVELLDFSFSSIKLGQIRFELSFPLQLVLNDSFNNFYSQSLKYYKWSLLLANVIILHASIRTQKMLKLIHVRKIQEIIIIIQSVGLRAASLREINWC